MGKRRPNWWAIWDFEFGRTVINGVDCVALFNSERQDSLIKSNRTWRRGGFRFMGSGEVLKNRHRNITAVRRVH